MAEKEATVYIVDVGKSMERRRHGRSESDLEWALQYVWDKITATVLTGRKTANVGVIGLGTEETDNELGEDESYRHISVLQPLSQIQMSELRHLQQVLRVNRNDQRDPISAVVVAIQMIRSFCKHLKYLKKIILVTNGTGAVDPDDIDDIATKAKQDGIEIVILGVDFDDSDYGFKEEDKPPTKAYNEGLLRTLAEKSDGVFGTLQEAIEELQIPRIKPVRPIASYKGELRLGDPENYNTALSIQVERYPKVVRRAVPSASAFVVRPIAASQYEDDAAGVRSSYHYTIRDPAAAGGTRDIPREELAKGYEYGRTAVHIGESDQNITKFETVTSYEIIGFIANEKIERYAFIGSSFILVAQKGNIKASLALSSLAHALYEVNSCVVARFVKKDMTEPQINILSPMIEPDFEALIENQLPFAEDIRSYRFPSLDRVLTVSGKSLVKHRNLPNNELSVAMDDFVDSMMISDEKIPIDEVFSPVLHRLEDCIKFRAVHQDEQVPRIAKVLIQPAHPPKVALEASKANLQMLIEAADVKKVPSKAKGRRKYREQEKPLSGLDVEKLFRKDGQASRHISADNAIPEFKQMLDNSENLGTVEDAVKQMKAIVEKRITDSFADLAYERALEEISVVRQEIIELEVPGLYNDMLRDMKRKLFSDELGGNRREMWFRIRNNRLGLIDKRLSNVSDVTQQEAETFMSMRG